MNSENAKELEIWQNSMLARGKVCDFAFLTSSGGKFYMIVGLAVPPLSVKNRDVLLIG